MQMLRKRLGATALAACLLVALAFGGAIALAVGTWWTPGGNTLTVTADSNESLVADLESGAVSLDLDLYRVAEAEADDMYDTFNYVLNVPFSTEELQAALESAQAGEEDWENFAELATAVVAEHASEIPDELKTTATMTGTTTNISLEADGVYLVLPHGSNVTDGSQTAISLYKRYAFSPSVISLPTKYSTYYGKDSDQNAPASSVDSAYRGDWNKEVTIALKVGEEPLYGNLEIVKQLTEPATQRVSFDFLVESTSDSPYKYKNYVTITCEPGESEVVGYDEHIPAGTIVTVKEAYDGASYAFVSADGSTTNLSGPFTIVSDEAVEAEVAAIPSTTFVNQPDTDTEGYAINNKFKYEEDEGWVLVEDEVTPEGALHEDPNKPEN